MNRLSPEKRVGILEDMVESKSLRAISRTRAGNARRSSSDPRNKPVSLNTVYKLVVDAGDTAIDFVDQRLRNLPCTRIEADEAYTWVRMHPVRVKKCGLTDPEIGVFWIWIAIDPVSKLIVHYHIGGRGYEDGQAFIDGLAERIPHRFQLTTDSLASYPRAVEKRFGANIDYATVKKRDAEEERLRAEMGDKAYRKHKKERGDEREMSVPEVVVGNPDLQFATTNHIESFFQKFRQNLRRMVRKTTGYSKTVANLRRAVALYVFHYNFCRVHRTIGTTPAIAAGIEDTRWEWEHFLDLVNAYTAEKRKRRAQIDEDSSPEAPEREAPVEPPMQPFLVYHDPEKDYSKVHQTSCKNARLVTGTATKTGRFWLCETLDEALALAEQKAPERAEKCKICFTGHRHILEYRDPGRPSPGPKPRQIR